MSPAGKSGQPGAHEASGTHPNRHGTADAGPTRHMQALHAWRGLRRRTVRVALAASPRLGIGDDHDARRLGRRQAAAGHARHGAVRMGHNAPPDAQHGRGGTAEGRLRYLDVGARHKAARLGRDDAGLHQKSIYALRIASLWRR